MKNLGIFFLVLIYHASIAQTFSLEKTVFDKVTKEPLAYVDVYKKNHYVTKNAEGQFEIITNLDSLNFNLLGYKKYKNSITRLKDEDVILLEPLESNLGEVEVKSDSQWIDTALENHWVEVFGTTFTHRFFYDLWGKEMAKL